MIAADYSGDPTPSPSSTCWRLLAAWLPMPFSATLNLAAYLTGVYDPVRHDVLDFPGWLVACVLSLLAGVILTVRGIRRLHSESDGAFVWRALLVQLAIHPGIFFLCQLFKGLS